MAAVIERSYVLVYDRFPVKAEEFRRWKLVSFLGLGISRSSNIPPARKANCYLAAALAYRNWIVAGGIGSFSSRTSPSDSA